MRPPNHVPQLLTRLARDHPERAALSDDVRTLDYRALDTVAGQVAAALRARGLGPGQRVVLVGPRDARLFALLHGVLRCGAAAVVPDAGSGRPELARRLRASAAGCVITADPGADIPGHGPVVVFDVDALATAGPAPALAPGAGSDLAYLSFTSGSAGAPRAVAVSHANAVHYALALRERLGFTAATAPCIAHVTTLAADLGHTAWLLALATAGRVHVVSDRDARDPQGCWSSMAAAGVSCLKTTPSHIAALLPGRPLDAAPLHTLLLGGEALARPLAAQLLATGITRRLVNHYGPTETTIGACCFVATNPGELPADEATVPIGTPVGQAVLRLVGPDGAEEFGAAAGELFIGGAGVAAGYFGQPAETANRFVEHGGLRMYRTGDICRRRQDGNLVFLGRADRQVKISGHRVDPPEIERVLDAAPGVAQSAVVVRGAPGTPRLVAAVRLSDGRSEAETMEALRSHLRARLPGHSIPAPIVALASFPLGPNGKLDRQRLTSTLDRIVQTRAGATIATPARHTGQVSAQEIAALWREALGLPGLDLHADVFALGGDSILAMRTVALLRRRGSHATFDDVYRHPTPASLAAAASTAEHRDPTPSPAPRRALGPAQRWFFRQPIRDPNHWNQVVLLRCQERVNPAALSRAVRAVLRRHSALRHPVSPTGPAAQPRAADDLDVLTFGRISPGVELGAWVAGVSAELHRGLDPGAGRLVRVHLFGGAPEYDDRLVIVAHHLAVDGLSWRILLDDLAGAYRAAVRGPVSAEVPPAGDYYQWAAASPTRHLPEPVADQPLAEPGALSWALDAAATARLSEGRAHHLEAVLLAAFGQAVLACQGRPRLAVEVEAHGRDVDGGEHLDTVGWFTAVRWVQLAHGDGVDAVERAVRAAPLRPMDADGPRPQVGFNFLGTFRLPEEPALRWSVGTEHTAAARCPSADPLYTLRLTARIVDGRLVADLVHRADSAAAGRQIMNGFVAAVAEAAGTSAQPPLPQPFSTSGVLLHSAAGPTATARVSVLAEPARVLLTGATGYLGGHLLAELLRHKAQVSCLVRGRGDTLVRPQGADRAAVRVLAGDLTLDGLGLSPTDLRAVRSAQVIVHAAADVRLLARPEELRRTNVEGLRRLLDLVDQVNPGARLHHVSTLAVAGHPDAGHLDAGHLDTLDRPFSEADLWVGQRFLTPYEHTKFAAEQLLRSWTASGRQSYVHRSGHVAAHSRTGAFQRNVADNRIYQTVRGYLLAAAAPRRPSVRFAFSHVDTVAAGITALALHPYTLPGVYHVETPHEVAHDELVRWLAGAGYQVRLVDEDTFLAAIDAVDDDGARIAASWSRLYRRAATIDRRYSTAVLHRLGVRFTEPTPQWWAAALAWAAGAGFLPPPSQPVPDQPVPNRAAPLGGRHG